MSLALDVILAAVLGLTAPSPELQPQLEPGPASRPRPLVLVGDDPTVQSVLVVEKASQTLRVYECSGGEARLRRELPCTTGKSPGDKWFEGDLRTPEGVYWFRRHLDGETLPPLYGAGALTMDYPNEFDLRDGKTGSGIWMHGVETNDRVHAARDTRGCVAVRNDHFEELLALVRLERTPIVVVDRIEQVQAHELAAEADTLRDLLETWRRSWERKDLPSYARLYDPDFHAEGLRRDDWLRRKARLADRHAGIRVAADDVTILREKNRFWITFRQEFVTDGHRDVGRKTLAVLDHGPAASASRYTIVGERWQPLSEEFALLDPRERPEPLDPIRLAALHPDAAPAAPPPAAAPRAGARPAPPVRTVAPPTDAASAIERSTTTPPLKAPPEPSPPAVTPEPRPEPPVVEPPTVPEPPVRPRAAEARLSPPGLDRGLFRLLAPWASIDDAGVHVDVQLLNSRPTRPRDASLTWTAHLPEDETITGGRSVRLRQGELVSLDLPWPRAAEPSSLVVTVTDAAGRAALVQEIVVSWQ